MGSSIANKVFIFTLIIIVGFLFIWTGGLNTLTNLLDTVTSKDDSYSASLPASEDMILHGALFTFTLYLAYTVASGPGKKIDKISSDFIFNVNNLIIPIELPKNLVAPKNKKPDPIISRGDKKMMADESKHIKGNTLSEYEKTILDENEKDSGLNGSLLKSVRRKVNISEMVYGATKVSTPPPYVTSFLSPKSKTRYIENFNKENERIILNGSMNKKIPSSQLQKEQADKYTDTGTENNNTGNSATSKKYNPMTAIYNKSKDKGEKPTVENNSDFKKKIKVDPMEKLKKIVTGTGKSDEKTEKEDRPSTSSASYFD